MHKIIKSHSDDNTSVAMSEKILTRMNPKFTKMLTSDEVQEKQELNFFFEFHIENLSMIKRKHITLHYATVIFIRNQLENGIINLIIYIDLTYLAFKKKCMPWNR